MAAKPTAEPKSVNRGGTNQKHDSTEPDVIAPEPSGGSGGSLKSFQIQYLGHETRCTTTVGAKDEAHAIELLEAELDKYELLHAQQQFRVTENKDDKPSKAGLSLDLGTSANVIREDQAEIDEQANEVRVQAEKEAEKNQPTPVRVVA